MCLLGNAPSPCVQSDDQGQFLMVTCGNIEGKCYLTKFKKGVPSSKCVYYNSKWCSLVEFENFGGKCKSKNWRRSIKHNSISLGSIFDTNPSLLSVLTTSNSSSSNSNVSTHSADKHSQVSNLPLSFATLC